MIKADGKPDKVTAKVTAAGKRVKGIKVSVGGAGVSKAARTNGKGVAVLRINPRKPGIITVTVVESNQQLCGRSASGLSESSFRRSRARGRGAYARVEERLRSLLDFCFHESDMTTTHIRNLAALTAILATVVAGAIAHAPSAGAVATKPSRSTWSDRGRSHGGRSPSSASPRTGLRGSLY